MDSRRAASAVAFAAALFLKPDAAADISVDATALASRPPRELRSMMGEASALWRPQGVTLVWIASPAARALGARRALDVVPDDGAVRGASWHGARL